MIRFTQNDLNAILADLLGKPWQRDAAGPQAYDCYGLVKTFMARAGVEIADIGKADPDDSRAIYEQEQQDYIRLSWPRPWSLVTFSDKQLNAHVGVVLPGDNLFLHCPRRGAAKVIAEPLSRQPWQGSIDGYWWPKGYIETVVLLTPMTTTKRAWQFVKAQRSLAQIVEQDTVEGRDVPVDVFLDGQQIPQDQWMSTVPTEMQQLVVRPAMEGGKNAGMMFGMIALAILAPAVAGKFAAAAAGGATTGAAYTFAYGMTQAAVMMAGGLALNALIGADEAKRDPSQYYSGNPQTVQKPGGYWPLVYGTYGVRGNIVSSYTTTVFNYQGSKASWGGMIKGAREEYNFKIAYSDGPIEGIVAGTEKVNDRAPEEYKKSEQFTLEHFRGTDGQPASMVPDALEIPVNVFVGTNQTIATTFTAVDCNRAYVVLRFPNGMTNWDDGDAESTTVWMDIQVRPTGAQDWHMLYTGWLVGKATKPMHIPIPFDGVAGDIPGCGDIEGWHNQKTGQTYTTFYVPYPLTIGQSYEVAVTRTSSTHSDHGDDFFFDSIKCEFAETQKLPGLAYTAIGSAASSQIWGSLQYYAVVKGKLVRVYHSDTQTWTIEWTDNPAWVAYDLLTRPVIKGNWPTMGGAPEAHRR